MLKMAAGKLLRQILCSLMNLFMQITTGLGQEKLEKIQKIQITLVTGRRRRQQKEKILFVNKWGSLSEVLVRKIIKFMKQIYLSIIFILFFSIWGKGQGPISSKRNINELEWKKEWIDIFFREYRNYEEYDLGECFDKDRSIRFDIERKLKAINQFHLESTIIELEMYLDSSEIKFDSLIMLNSHSWHYEEEYNFAPVSFYLYSKGQIRMMVAYFDDDQKPTIEEQEENVKEFYKNVENLKNGCGYGFNTLTVFNEDLSNWEIKRIVINPDE
jgi:hypothetical protein